MQDTHSWLDTDNIRASHDGVERHPLRPFLPANAQVLFLGSFPPQRHRWCMDFYYPNFINDHWRIEGEVFFSDRNRFVLNGLKSFDLGAIVNFCTQRGIAFYDTSTAVRRLQDNASDKFLEVVEPTDVRALAARLPRLRAIATTGEKATATLCASLDIPSLPRVGTFAPIPGMANADGRQVVLYRLPSSSRAYPLAFDKKVEAYRQMFRHVGLLPAAPPRLASYDMGPTVFAFSTMRHGGCSEGAYAGFNINRYSGDTDEHIRANREALCRILRIADDCLLMPHQVHEARVARIDQRFLSLPPEAQQTALEGVDALTTDLPGVCIGVSTADCIPVLLSDARHGAVCAIHAGWRGTAKRIAERAVAAMAEAYGTRPSDLVAQIGPGIRLESFEVGQEVYDAFAAAGFDMAPISRLYPANDDPTRQKQRIDLPANDAPVQQKWHIDLPANDAPAQQKWHIDLPECNRLQFLHAGLSPEAISDCGICTFEHHDTYFSARRLGIRSGRIFTAIMRLPAHPLSPPSSVPRA